MPTHEDQVTDPLYWNWVKGGLGLKYLTEGLELFVDDTLKTVQAGFFYDIRNNTPGLQEVKCTECTTANVLPCPTPGICNLRKRGGICTYHDKTDILKTSRPCPNSICDTIRVKISHQHRFSNPSWKNTNAQNWCTNHYEIGKCFLPKSGYENKTAISETDSSGLLNLSINCLPIQNRLDVNINHPNDILSKILKARNSILHSSSCTLANEQLESYIDDMVTLLEDKKILLADSRAQTAVLKLTQLKNGQLYISPKNELDIRNEALRAVEEKKEEAIQTIQDKQVKVIDSIKETHEVKRRKMSEEMTAHTETMASQCDALRSSIQTLKSTQDSIENHEHRLKGIEHTFSQIKTSQEQNEMKLTKLLKDFSDFKDDMKEKTKVEHHHKEKIEYLKRKQNLQTKLCEMYKSHIESLPLSPVLDGLDARVDDLFVELVICDDKTHEPRTTNKNFKENAHDSGDKTHEPKSYGKKVEGYKDIFVRTTYECKNKCLHECDSDCEKEERECKCKNMYVIGDAGMGKTTWCMKMVSLWVGTLMTNVEATDEQGKFSDEKIMSEIDILFFVSLRHAINDVAIVDMVRHQLFEEFPEMNSIAQDVLKTEPQKCLIILDGLDEWKPSKYFKVRSSFQHPGLPSKQDLRGCPILTTTRPWKLDEVRLSNFDIDRAVKIQGLTNQNSLIEKVICHLNDTAVSGGNLQNKRKRDFVLAFEAAFNTSLGRDYSYDDGDDDYDSNDDYYYSDDDDSSSRSNDDYDFYDDDDSTSNDDYDSNDDDDSNSDNNDDSNDHYDDDTDNDDAFLSSNKTYEGVNEYKSNISFHKIPLILVFMVCLLYDEGKLETTWAANFSGLVVFLIRIAERNIDGRRPGRLSVKDNLTELKAKWSESSRYLPDSLKKIKRLTNYSELILKLSKLAFRSLFNDSKESTLVFTEESLENELTTDELDVALKIGLLSQSKVVGKTLKRLTSLSFLHKSIQELFASLFLVWKTENDDKTALNKYINYCRTTKNIREMENVLMFVCGLSPGTASEMSRHVADVTQYDLKDLLNLKTKCVLEMQEAHGLSYPSKECQIFTYDMTLREHADTNTCIKLAKTNSECLVSLKLGRRTQVPELLPDMTQLQKLTITNANLSVQQNDILDLSQLNELKTIHLQELDSKCILILDGWKLQNVLMIKCCSIEIKTRVNCRVAIEAMSTENIDTACKIKDISLIHCTDCKMSIEGEVCSFDNVSFKECDSCQFTIKACKETHGARITSTGQISNIHSIVIDSSKNLTLDINNKVEVEGVQIMDSETRFTETVFINNLFQQLPRVKQIDIKHGLFNDHFPLMLPNEVDDIAIPIQLIENIRGLSNIVHLKLHGTRSDTILDNLTEILPSLTKLKSFELHGNVTTTVLNTLTNICIERLVLCVYDEIENISHYLLRIQHLQYLKLTDIRLSNCLHLSHMLLHMPQLKTLSMDFAFSSFVIDTDHGQHNDKDTKELQLEKFCVYFRGWLTAPKLPKQIVNYLKHCCHLKDLSCQTHVLEQLSSEKELTPILTQVETFKIKDEGRVDVSFGTIIIMSNVRHVNLGQIFADVFDQVCGVFANLEHLETLKFEFKGSNSSNVSISRQFVDSLPITRKQITIEVSNCRLDYDVEQYLRSRQWLQSVDRTAVKYKKNYIFLSGKNRSHDIKILIWKKIN